MKRYRIIPESWSFRARAQRSARTTCLRVEELESREVLTTPTSTIPFLFNVPAGVGPNFYVAMFGQDAAAGATSGTPIYWDITGNYSSVSSLSGANLPTTQLTVPNSGGSFTIQIPNLTATNGDTLASARIVIGVNAPPVIPTPGGNPSPPNPGNAADPNNSIYYDFIEFTLDTGGLHLNTTTIDQFGFPFTATGSNLQAPITPSGVGVQIPRATAVTNFGNFLNSQPAGAGAANFLDCLTDGNIGGVQYRILAPQDVMQLESPPPVQVAPALVNGGTLTAGQTFYYVITGTNNKGVGGNGETQQSNFQNQTSNGVPGQQSIKLNWQPYLNATGYNIYRSTSSAGPYQFLASVSGGATTTYTDTGSATPTAQTPPGNNYTYEALNAYFNPAINAFFNQYLPTNSFSLTVKDASGNNVTLTGNTTTIAGGYTVLQVTGNDPGVGPVTLDVYEPYFSSNTNTPGAPAPPSWLVSTGLQNQSPGQMVTACDAVFNSGGFDNTTGAPSKLLSNLENPIVSALNRGIATTVAPANWATSSSSFYAPGSISNYYAAFFHQGGTSVADSNGNELAYGFPYDDQGGFASFWTSNPIGTVTINLEPWTTAPVNPPSAGFDELGSYRPSNGAWSLDSNGQFGFQFGGAPGPSPGSDRVMLNFIPSGVTLANVQPVSGDWAGIGTTEIGDFVAGTWYLDLNNNGQIDPGETFTFGTFADGAVPGRYLPGGGIELAVFRAIPGGVGEFVISDANWLQEAQAGKQIGIAETFDYGAAGDHVVVGDWNGAGLTEVGVYRPATAFGAPNAYVFSLDVANHHAFDSSNKVFIFGATSDGVVIGDWNGSGTDKVGVYRPATAFGAPSTAVFSLDETGQFMFNSNSRVFLFGLATDEYVTGDWAFTTASASAQNPLPADVLADMTATTSRHNPTALDTYFAQS